MTALAFRTEGLLVVVIFLMAGKATFWSLTVLGLLVTLFTFDRTVLSFQYIIRKVVIEFLFVQKNECRRPPLMFRMTCFTPGGINPSMITPLFFKVFPDLLVTGETIGMESFSQKGMTLQTVVLHLGVGFGYFSRHDVF